MTAAPPAQYRLVLDIYPELHGERFERQLMGAATCFTTELALDRALAAAAATFTADGWQIARLVQALQVTRAELGDADQRLFDLAADKGLYADVATAPRHLTGRLTRPLAESFPELCRVWTDAGRAVVLWSASEGRPITLRIDDLDALPVFRHQGDAALWSPTWRSDCTPRWLPLATLDHWLHELAFGEEHTVALGLDEALVTFHPAAVHAQIAVPHGRPWTLTDRA